MFLRALFAFLALPGIVAFAVPIWWLTANSRTELQHAWGLALLLVGCTGLLWCVRDFYVFGKGTLAPWSPPQYLVTFGAWRGLGVYAAIVAVVFHFRVVLFEEPWLARTHGEVWTDYARRVRRWL